VIHLLLYFFFFKLSVDECSDDEVIHATKRSKSKRKSNARSSIIYDSGLLSFPSNHEINKKYYINIDLFLERTYYRPNSSFTLSARIRVQSGNFRPVKTNIGNENVHSFPKSFELF